MQSHQQQQRCWHGGWCSKLISTNPVRQALATVLLPPVSASPATARSVQKAAPAAPFAPLTPDNSTCLIAATTRLCLPAGRYHAQDGKLGFATKGVKGIALPASGASVRFSIHTNDPHPSPRPWNPKPTFPPSRAHPSRPISRTRWTAFSTSPSPGTRPVCVCTTTSISRGTWRVSARAAGGASRLL